MGSALRPARFTAHFPTRVRNVLVVVNGLQDLRALATELRAMAARETVRIYLLAVLAPITGQARMFLRPLGATRLRREAAQREMQPLCRLLDVAGISYSVHIEAGPWLETLCGFAADRCCRRILVGENRAHPLKNLLLRHDRWRIGVRLHALGFDCSVVQRGAPAMAVAVAQPPAAHPGRPSA